MKHINSVTLEARLTRDPDVRVCASRNGEAPSNMYILGLCFSKDVKNADGTWSEKPSFINGLYFCKKNLPLKKGDLVLVVGELDQNTYINRDGIEVKDMQIKIEFLDKVDTSLYKAQPQPQPQQGQYQGQYQGQSQYQPQYQGQPQQAPRRQYQPQQSQQIQPQYQQTPAQQYQPQYQQTPAQQYQPQPQQMQESDEHIPF